MGGEKSEKGREDSDEHKREVNKSIFDGQEQSKTEWRKVGVGRKFTFRPGSSFLRESVLAPRSSSFIRGPLCINFPRSSPNPNPDVQVDVHFLYIGNIDS